MRKLLRDLPVSRKLIAIVWLFLFVVVGLLGLSYLAIENLSAVRAYVGGEGLWSKAQKQAVYALLQYSLSRSEQDYQTFQRALLVPSGDRQARLELEKPTPDLGMLRSGLLQGRNSPDDIEGMVTLYRRFRHTKYMEEAVTDWTKADLLIEELYRLGEELHREIGSARPNEIRITEIVRQINDTERELMPLEDAFSYSLGAGAREASALFRFMALLATVTSLLAGISFTIFVLRHVRQSEERHNHLIDTANDTILVIDAETETVLEANAKSGELLGRPVQEILGMPAELLVVQSDRGAYREMLEEMRKGSAISGKELRLNHSDGRTIAVEINASLTEFEGKKLVQGIFRDVRERKRLEEEARQIQKMEVVGRLVTGIAHDFNNLLMVMFMQVSRIRADSKQPLVLQRTATIRTAAEKAASLTKELLAFGRRQVLVLQVLDLNDLLGELSDMLFTLRTKAVQLTIAPSSQPLPVKVDPGKIDQVIMNLAMNARDAMPLGGMLRIRTAQVSGPSSEATGISPSTPYAVVEVSDTGQGLDADAKAHLFEPFFTTKPAGKGMGLGLSTALGIVKQSGGRIEVESSPNQGTTFRVYLPIAKETIQPRRRPKVASTALGGAETILLVEDQPWIRDGLREFLVSQGYRVLEAHNGMEALQIGKSHGAGIDVLVTDIIMPQLRGAELSKLLEETHPGIRVIFMSGYSEDALVEHQLLSERNIPLIQKPFDAEDLARKIREVLDERKNSRE
jgi:PAS domain S-box-containing protein